jgi:hypothetical protein
MAVTSSRRTGVLVRFMMGAGDTPATVHNVDAHGHQRNVYSTWAALLARSALVDRSGLRGRQRCPGCGIFARSESSAGTVSSIARAASSRSK